MWRQFSATVAGPLAEPLADFFLSLGAVAVDFEDAGDQPLFEPKPGETPLSLMDRVMFALAKELPENKRGVYAEVPKGFG